jgi:hypothetical protein
MQVQPSQFIMCGVIQLTTDILLLVQMLTYGKEAYSNV